MLEEPRSRSSESLEGVLMDVGTEMSECGLRCGAKIVSRLMPA